MVVALVGAPYDGAATLGWPGARYAPAEVRRHLAWMRMRVQDGHIYWVDEDRVVPWRGEQLVDAGDAAVVPHDLGATLAAVRAKTRDEAAAGHVPAVIGGDDSILFPAVAGVHDAVSGSLGIVHFDAHLDLLDESPAQGRYSQSSGMRRARSVAGTSVSPTSSMKRLELGKLKLRVPTCTEWRARTRGSSSARRIPLDWL